ncbi:MAG: (2Fe-2S) ferredoxin domain-containing protein [Gemmatimonadaceae bacterium]|nr:(2Fe-2S) ferredoxin domain-containing protein [Gemmatimonadaceae bacterium]
MGTRDLTGTRHVVLVCAGDSCHDRGADKVTRELRRAVREAALDTAVHLVRTRCLGRCDEGCTVAVEPDQVWYREVTPKLARRIVHEHLAAGAPIAARASYRAGPDGLEAQPGTKRGKPRRLRADPD